MTRQRQARSTTPVLVAGAGPAGLAAAAELSFHRVPCVVVEPRPDVAHDRPRAKTTSARTMEHFRRWGVADGLRAAAPLPVSWSQRVLFCESLSGRAITAFDNAFGLVAHRDERFAECGQQVPQPVVEEVLRRHVAARATVDLRLGSRVVDLTDEGECVAVAVRDVDGHESVVRARHVLGCDGAGSVVRDRIGGRFVGRSDARPNFNIVFRAPGLDTRLGPAVQYWVLGAPTPGLIGRMDLDGLWWAICPGVTAEHGTAHVEELITGLVGRRVALDVISTDTWTARMLVADTFQRGRIHLVGESAHLNPPWGGHGYNTCVGDAVNIAWKIAAVEQGWARGDILRSYGPERRAVAESTVASAEANMRSLAGDLVADAAAIQATKAVEFHSLGLTLGYTYAGSPIVQDAPAVALDAMSYVPGTDPGARLPHAWLPDGSSLFDHLGPAMTVVGPVNRHRSATEQLATSARRLGIPLTLVESPRHYPWADEFLLVRPDQHIAWRADDPRDLDLVAATALSRSATA